MVYIPHGNCMHSFIMLGQDVMNMLDIFSILLEPMSKSADRRTADGW